MTHDTSFTPLLEIFVKFFAQSQCPWGKAMEYLLWVYWRKLACFKEVWYHMCSQSSSDDLPASPANWRWQLVIWCSLKHRALSTLMIYRHRRQMGDKVRKKRDYICGIWQCKVISILQLNHLGEEKKQEINNIKYLSIIPNLPNNFHLETLT